MTYACACMHDQFHALNTIYYNNCVLQGLFSVRLIRLRRPDLAPDLYLPFGLYRIDVFCHQCLLADQAFCIRPLSLLIKVLHRKWSRQKQKQERNYDRCSQPERPVQSQHPAQNAISAPPANQIVVSPIVAISMINSTMNIASRSVAS